MEQAFYSRVNEFVQPMDVKKRNKYLIKAKLYNEVVQILKGKCCSKCHGGNGCFTDPIKVCA